MSTTPLTLKRTLTLDECTLVSMELANRRKSPLVAYVLWFFAGVLGAHQFYLRHVWDGLFYLLLPPLTLVGMASLPDDRADVLIAAVGAWVIVWVRDLCTLWRQTGRVNQRIAVEIIHEVYP